MDSISPEDYAKLMDAMAEHRRSMNAIHTIIENTYKPLELKYAHKEISTGKVKSEK